MTSFSESRREDPIVRKLVEDKLAAQKEALLAAESALIEARSKMTSATSFELMEASPLFSRANWAVLSALGSVRTALQHSDTTDTYIGNLAASRFGEIVENEAAGRS